MVDERKRLIPQRNDVQEEENVPFCCCPRLKNRKIAQATVLLTVALERFSFYSISGNLVLFLTVRSLKWESYNAINASLYFLGISFITCLFGGWLADAFTGRLRAILLAFVAYLVGYVLLLLLSDSNFYLDSRSTICRLNDTNADSNNSLPDENCVWQVYITLTIIAVGTGVVKANLAPFGADQVRGESSDSSTAFFHWFYWSINVGTLVALTAITYVQQQGDFFSAYLTASICLTVAMLVFFCGKCSYVIRKPVGSVFKNIYKIVREACRIRRRKTHHSSRGNYNTMGTVDTGDHQEPTSFLDHAKFRYGGSFHDSSVENVKVLGKIVCVFLALIPYWMVYFQIETSFLVQGLHMKLSFQQQTNVKVCDNPQPHVINNSSSVEDAKPFQIVAAWLSLFDVVLLIVILPIMNKVVYPWISRSGYNFTMERRIALGLVFSVFAAFSAGLVENFRLQRLYKDDDESTCCYRCINQLIGNSIYCAADMSILYQIPQYTLIGLSEVFTSVAGLEFACSIAPQSLKSSVMGLFYFFSGLGSLFSVGLVYVLMGHWFHGNNLGDINCRCVSTTPGNKACHLDYYFYTLGGIQILGFVAFLIVIWKCKLRKEIISISVQDPATATRPNPFKADDETPASTATSEVGVRTRIPVNLNRTISQDHSGRINRLVSDER